MKQFYEHYHEQSYICSHDKRKIVSLAEGTCNYVLCNDMNKELVVYHIDGGVIRSDDNIRCDYGIYTEDDVLILVELKGCRCDDAMKQIINTIELLFGKSKLQISKISARVVLSKAPNVDYLSSEEIKLKKLLRNRYDGTLIKKSRKLKEVLSSI